MFKPKQKDFYRTIEVKALDFSRTGEGFGLYVVNPYICNKWHDSGVDMTAKDVKAFAAAKGYRFVKRLNAHELLFAHVDDKVTS